MRSISYYLKIIFTLIVIALGIYSLWFSYIGGLLLLVYSTFASILIGIVVWIIVGKIATTDFFVKALTTIRRVEPISAEQIDTVEKGYFMLKNEKVETRSGILFHVSETLEKPLFPILFLIGILTIAARFSGTTEFYTITNVAILFFGSILLGLVVPTIWIIKDSDWMFFNRTKRKIIRASDWLESFFRGFASAGTIFGFIILFIGVGVFSLFIFVIFFLLGTSGFIIVVTVFFYLFFHRNYVETVNSKLKERGLVAAELHIEPA